MPLFYLRRYATPRHAHQPFLRQDHFHGPLDAITPHAFMPSLPLRHTTRRFHCAGFTTFTCSRHHYQDDDHAMPLRFLAFTLDAAIAARRHAHAAPLPLCHADGHMPPCRYHLLFLDIAIIHAMHMRYVTACARHVMPLCHVTDTTLSYYTCADYAAISLLGMPTCVTLLRLQLLPFDVTPRLPLPTRFHAITPVDAHTSTSVHA